METGAVALTGGDTVKFNGQIIDELANAESVLVSFPNDLVNVDKGKNGTSIISKIENGTIAEVTMRVLRGGSKDKLINNSLQSFLNDVASFVLVKFDFIKRLGDGEGNISNDIYNLKGGSFSKLPETRSAADGNTEQAVTVYTLRFIEAKIIKG